MTDEALMEELKGGRDRSLQILHARYAPLVFGIATRSLGTAAAEDVVQDVLLEVWRSRASYEPQRGTVRSWILEIAHSRVLNELRRRRRKPTEPLEMEDFAASADGVQEAAIWEAQRRQALDRALAELPAHESRALRLAFFGELSHSEVATFLEEPLGTVKTRVRSGLRRLWGTLNPVFGTSLLALVAALGGLWLARADSRRADRAVRMLSLSDSQIIRMTAADGIAPETHGTYRWHPGDGTAVITFSNPPALERGARHVAWADFDGHWVELCTLATAGQARELCVSEVTGIGTAPRALRVTIEPRSSDQPRGNPLVLWSSPRAP